MKNIKLKKIYITIYDFIIDTMLDAFLMDDLSFVACLMYETCQALNLKCERQRLHQTV